MDSDRIERVQKKFTSFALRHLTWGYDFWRPPYWSRLCLMGMKSLKCRRDIASAVMIFDLLKGNLNVPILAEMEVVEERDAAATVTRLSAGRF